MDPISFINGMFMFAGGDAFAKMLAGRALVFNRVEDLLAVGQDGIGHNFPEEGQARYREAVANEQEPDVCWHEEYGWFVTHNFDGELRMVCWAEMGEAEFSKFLAEWWKKNNEAYTEGGLLDQLGIDGGGWRQDR